MDHLSFKQQIQGESQYRYMFRFGGTEFEFELKYGDLMVKLQKYHNIDMYIGTPLSNHKITIEESGYDYLQEHDNHGTIGVCVYDMKSMKMIAIRHGEYDEMDEMITMMQEMANHADHLAVVTYPVV